MSRLAVAVVLSSVLVSQVAMAASPSAKREQLAASSRERIMEIARTLTIVNWTGQINELLGEAPAAKNLGAKWNPSEPHWDKAVDELLTDVMKIFGDLHDAPEAVERMTVPFRNNLTEAEAAEVLALSADERKQVDDFADTMTLAVAVLEHRPDVKPGSPEYQESLARLTGMAGLPTIHDLPKVKLAPKTLTDYRQARSSSANFFLTAIDGQLKLFWFDHHDELAGIANKAAREAVHAK
jgi:hypothetical protein